MTVFPRPLIVTLTTDFGTQDHYVGSMKGAILRRNSAVIIIDITHETPAFSILDGAYAIAQAAPYFPAGTVHVVVVDPGVGSPRRPLAVQANKQLFVAPDNGVLTLILNADPGTKVRELARDDLWLEPRSQTFHGRDLFGPAGASLAIGSIAFEEVGPIVNDPVLLSNLRADVAGNGRILSVDRFGNLITNFTMTEFGARLKSGFRIQAGSASVETAAGTFAECRPGQLLAYGGSSGFIEIGVNGGSAASVTGCKTGDPVWLTNVS